MEIETRCGGLIYLIWRVVKPPKEHIRQSSSLRKVNKNCLTSDVWQLKQSIFFAKNTVRKEKSHKLDLDFLLIPIIPKLFQFPHYLVLLELR